MLMRMKTFLVGLMLGCCLSAQAEPGQQNCRLIINADSGEVLFQDGPCDVRRSPCSTFKVPLALMGFDAGILTNQHVPVWDYLKEYPSSRPEEQIPIDPTSWEKISVVWYSQKLTRALGMPAFKNYVDQFDYGNRDLAGDPGKNNGLTHSWLMSSLLISPKEQVRFLQRMLQQKLGVSDHATKMTKAILPQFPAADGWTVTGKTGSGVTSSQDVNPESKRHMGWFVGWAERGAQKVIFAEFLMDDEPRDDYAGPRARDALLKALPGIMAVGPKSPTPAQ
jgi:beta-lactamase class D